MNDYDYSTAADYARASGYHRTTIVKWIKLGKIAAVNKTVKSKKKNRNKHWKIAHKSIMFPVKKPHHNQGRSWSSAEKYILKNNLHLQVAELEKIIHRSRNAIKIMKCRIKKNSFLRAENLQHYVI